MKQSIIILSCFICLSVTAQNLSTVNITLNGNRNKEVRIDGKSYSVNTDVSVVTSTGRPIQVTGLNSGQHSIEVVRTNRYNNTTSTGNKTTFYLRPGYDMNITVNNDGTIQTSETRIRRNGGYGYQNRYKTPMSDENFDVLAENIRYMRGNTAKTTAINNAFNNTSNYFTTAQASELIQMVYSQSSRLTLAKASYKTITDPANFSQISQLLTNQASKTELDSYVRNYDSNNRNSGDNRTGNRWQTKVAMSGASFNTLYNNISNQFGLGAKMSSLTNEFNNSNNYFTAAQTRQLIQLVSDENNRLQLAKLAYDNITDQENYNQIYSLLNSQSSRNELDVYVRANSNGSNNNTGYTTRTAMTDASFTNLYNSVSNQFGLGVKMSSLTNEFNNNNNNFTAVQARQLIQLVSDENNRLQLAKLSYDNIVDPENFSKLYDLFSSQAKRNELADYARSYSYNR